MITAHTRDTLIAFETRIREKWEAGELPCLLHLCGGNETQLLEIFQRIQPGDWVFSSHRNHYHALLAGVPEEFVEQRIMDGGSMFMFWNPDAPHGAETGVGKPSCFFLSSSILAGTCGIAAGVAWDIRREFLRTAPDNTQAHMGQIVPRREPRVWCFVGDGAEEEGHFAEAVAFVAGHDLPCKFIVEDNDRQVDTPKRDRRGYHHGDFTRYIIWPPCVERYNYTATYPHAGSGCKHKIEFKPEAIARMKAAQAQT